MEAHFIGMLALKVSFCKLLWEKCKYVYGDSITSSLCVYCWPDLLQKLNAINCFQIIQNLMFYCTHGLNQYKTKFLPRFYWENINLSLYVYMCITCMCMYKLSMSIFLLTWHIPYYPITDKTFSQPYMFTLTISVSFVFSDQTIATLGLQICLFLMWFCHEVLGYFSSPHILPSFSGKQFKQILGMENI